MGTIILSILGVIVIFGVVTFIILKFLKPQRTGSVKSIGASIKEGIKVDFYPLESYVDGIPDLPPDNPIRKGFEDGRQARDKGNQNEAIGIFRKLLPGSEDSQKVALLNHIGICFYSQGKPDKALGSYKESLKLAEEIQEKDGIVVNLNNIGIIYYDKDSDSAIRNFNKAIELDPNYAIAFYNRGLVYGKNRGDYDSAIRDFKEAIKLAPNFAIAMANMGLAYKGKRDKENARQWWEKALGKKEYLPDGGEKVRQWLKELEE